MFSLILFKGAKRKMTLFNCDRKQNSRFAKPDYAFKNSTTQAKEVFFIIKFGKQVDFL